VRLSHIRPGRGSEMAQHPRSKGAFVDCVVAAGHEEHALEQVRAALGEDGYVLLDWDDIIDFNDASWGDKDVALAFKELAFEASFDNKVGYGPFYCYDNCPER
jgi:hypothetical protein